MQVALEGVPALAKLLFCLDMGRVGHLKSQLLLPPGMEVLRGVEESELRSPLTPCCARVRLALPSPSHEMLTLPIQIFPTVFWLQIMVARGSGSHWPAAPHHPHIALWVLLQNVGRLRVTSKPVCRSNRHSAGRRVPILVTQWPVQHSALLSIPSP